MIPPVEVDDRPPWSVMIPAWNAGRHLAATIESVLAGGLPAGSQVEVVDDRSTDTTAETAAAYAGRGVAHHLNPTQLGATANFNACLRRAEGRVVHLLHADDEVAPGFYPAMDAVLDGHADVVAAVCRTEYVDESGAVTTVTRSEGSTGIWADAVATLAVSNRVRPPGIVVRRSAYEVVGGFREDLHHAADWEMWARLALHGPVWFEDRVLARYRVHPSQDTAGRLQGAANIAERVAAIDIITGRLPPDEARRAARKALAYSSVFAGRTAVRLARRGSWAAAASQCLAGLRCAVAAVPGSPRLAGGGGER